jgi:hypothetical protein
MVGQHIVEASSVPLIADVELPDERFERSLSLEDIQETMTAGGVRPSHLKVSLSSVKEEASSPLQM